VLAFQAAQGLSADGVVGRRTWAALAQCLWNQTQAKEANP